MKIYIASRYSRRLEMLAHAEALQAAGHTVTSRWVFGAHDVAIPDEGLALPEHRSVAASFALEDISDVDKAELLLAFTEAPLPVASRGGRHWEAGMACAWGMMIWIVGPRENVFYCLEDVQQFADFAAVLDALGTAQRARQEEPDGRNR